MPTDSCYAGTENSLYYKSLGNLIHLYKTKNTTMVTASTLPVSMSTVKTAFCFMFVRSVCVPVLKTMAGILTVNNFLFGA